jgi:hypothetical protein
MKVLKTILFFIVLIFFGVTVFVNHEYFLTKYSIIIGLRLEDWQWPLPELTNLAYFGICFGIGLLLPTYLGLSAAFKSRRIIKNLNIDINSYHEQIVLLKTELDKFNNDPYINNTPEKEVEKSPEQEQST